VYSRMYKQTDRRNNSNRNHLVGDTSILDRPAMRDSSTSPLLQWVLSSVDSVRVAVFDRDEPTCTKLLWLHGKFRYVLPVVWVDPGLFPTLPWKR